MSEQELAKHYAEGKRAGIAQERERVRKLIEQEKREAFMEEFERDAQWLAWIEEEEAKLSNCGLVDGVAWLMLGRLRARAQEKP